MKRVERNHQTVFVIGDTTEHVEKTCAFYQSILENARSWEQKRLKTVGGTDAMVNEINALTPDMILSVLPSPDQEHFLMENCEKLSAGLWYGIGSWDFTKRRQGLLGNIRNLIRTHKLERQLIHYHGKQESIS